MLHVNALMRVCLTACVYRVTCERNGECLFNGVRVCTVLHVSAMVRVCLTACVYRVTCERIGEGLFNGVCIPCYM